MSLTVKKKKNTWWKSKYHIGNGDLDPKKQ